ncbi:hypothetical protein G7B40_018320 [Aetokthonos hydrillicola Thurmond2011]|jgi:hypothetical protein|uniref:Uncharacterized protein n=1 Tax=Aetokthonos hydrillicola Thurmond2011 TaxID=2712845 RepID=A0AAP5I849_9CYAN|nr:hypothetical protein [Aetokthonos hydrillicola]MBO3461040.1 hypothetical protein [Aetokthonos hydrillicola CCALA 1050]MBW4588390.1 hypothetical protein [Aetokthonos hydrillicola CCALA 1050]MDR9896500.1 hypothetical protein [Aetokthonos hydrillicola Thurmond2011]
MLLTSTDAGQIALEFLMAEWNISEEDREWFVIENSRLIGDIWYIVELAVEGFPDRWFIQVYDTGACDPDYTFISPIPASRGCTDFINLPYIVAEVLVSERNAR